MKYRKKPVVIDAVQWNGMGFDITAIPNWFAAAYQTRQIDRDGDKLHILTLEGMMTADANDWIIQGVKGEIYPCKPDIFEATYEKVDEEEKASGEMQIKYEKGPMEHGDEKATR